MKTHQRFAVTKNIGTAALAVVLLASFGTNAQATVDSATSGQSVSIESDKQAAVTAGERIPVIGGDDVIQFWTDNKQKEWAVGDAVDGPTDNTTAVRTAVQKLILASAKLNASPPQPSAPRSVIANAEGIATRHDEVAKVWHPSELAAHEQLDDANHAALAGDSRIETFDDVQQTITGWNKVEVHGDLAYVIVTGNSKRHTATGWINEGTIQWQLTLRAADDGAWLLTDEAVLLGSEHDQRGEVRNSTPLVWNRSNTAANALSGANLALTSWTYNPTAAVAYADRYSCNPPYTCRNSSYTSFGGSDCTNFVSQAVRAGGVAIGSDWQPYNYNWVNVSGFALMTYNRNFSPGYQLMDKTQNYNPASKGDSLVYDWGKGDGISHRNIQAGYGYRAIDYSADGQGDYIDQHATDRYHAPWNYGYLHPGSTVNASTMKIYREHLYTAFSN